MTDSKIQGDAVPKPAGLSDDVIVSPDALRADRLPPRQARTKKWPILDAHGPPAVAMESWRLEVAGLVEEPLSFDWKAFRALPRVQVFADMHCVTRWSRLGNVWEGVSTRTILERAGVSARAHFVVAHGYDRGFTTNIPLAAFGAEDALLADTHDGEPIPIPHGGPLRLIVPRLYAWKSAKWLSKIEFSETDRAGYWEELGYHMVGDPWKEQRTR